MDVTKVTAVALSPIVRMFALIIGIDDYANIRTLAGAVADAKAMNDYLEEGHRVPKDHIRTLFDKEATRDAIIAAFRGLQDDRRIQHGDPIVIFYAGHGCELSPPDGWGVQREIQCLLPCDYDQHADVDFKNSTNTHPIPDRTIGALIENIAKMKGDNITVIFDCCHSASGTRVENTEYVPRTVILDHHIPKDLDSTIWGSRTGKIPDSLAYHGLKSHVLLAACGEKERAYEHAGRGQFTTALLSLLKKPAVCGLTYAEVLDRIELKNQNPRCEGLNRSRPFFHAGVSAGREVHHSVRPVQGFKYVVSAGLAHGVSHGAEFTLYSDGKQRQHVILLDDTAVIADFQTTITIPLHLADNSSAKLTRTGKVPFYLSPFLKESLRRTLNDNGVNFRLVEDMGDAKLEVVVDGRLASFKILDERVNQYGVTRLIHSVALDNAVAQVLSAAAHYYWYLDLTNKDSRISTKPRVAIDFYLLREEYDDFGQPLGYVPVEPGFCQKDPNSDDSDVIDFIVDPEEVYGFKITNNTPWDLYLNAFLFNNNDLSIESYYTQQSDEKLEVPLKQNETFSIGYGPGGAAPFGYSLEEGQNVDVGYLKIFFSTRPVDLSDIVQRPHFSTPDARMKGNANERKARTVSRPAQVPSEPITDTWFTVRIPVVQRRR